MIFCFRDLFLVEEMLNMLILGGFIPILFPFIETFIL